MKCLAQADARMAPPVGAASVVKRVLIAAARPTAAGISAAEPAKIPSAG